MTHGLVPAAKEKLYRPAKDDKQSASVMYSSALSMCSKTRDVHGDTCAATTRKLGLPGFFTQCVPVLSQYVRRDTSLVSACFGRLRRLHCNGRQIRATRSMGRTKPKEKDIGSGLMIQSAPLVVLIGSFKL